VPPDRRAFLESLLSADERDRADRYLIQAPRTRFVVSRGTLREILGRTTSLSPEELRFSYPCVCGDPECVPSRRKPRLELDSHSPAVQFNLAHTNGLAMVAVSNGPEVGIDIERIERSAVIGPVAEHVLDPDEVVSLRALPVDQQVEAFYRAWTRKEAYAKARGMGVASPSRLGEPRGWCFRDVPAPAGYVASLAVTTDRCVVRTSWWPPENGT
jgi:4'-phosphopantetheinyl transferase